VVNRTVESSTTATDLISRSAPAPGHLVFGSSIRSNENFTACALKGSPLWNFTPGRSLNSQVVASTARQESASPGRRARLASRPTSVS
jgi:hypothetical protein